MEEAGSAGWIGGAGHVRGHRAQNGEIRCADQITWEWDWQTPMGEKSGAAAGTLLLEGYAVEPSDSFGSRY